MCCLPDSTPVGIQGARQTPYGLFHTGFHLLEQFSQPLQISTGPIVPNPKVDERELCLLTLGNHSPQSAKKDCSKEKKPFRLFGKVILTEEELSLSKNSSSDMNSEKTSMSDVSGTAIHPNAMGDNSSSEVHYLNQNHQVIKLGHCIVYMESDEVGHSLDLSIFGSYEDLYWRLANMFGIEKSDLANRLLYRDTTGMIKHIEDEPYDEFLKVARMLTVIMDSSSENGNQL